MNTNTFILSIIMENNYYNYSIWEISEQGKKKKL